MTNADPNRTPTFTLFGNDDFFLQSVCSNVGAAQGATPAPVTNQGPGCPAQGNGFAWNHGDIQPQIATTWQGWVGPGIAHLGQTSRIWTDHTDARPTLMTLLGLRDDYTWDGSNAGRVKARRSTLTPPATAGRVAAGPVTPRDARPGMTAATGSTDSCSTRSGRPTSSSTRRSGFR